MTTCLKRLTTLVEAGTGIAAPLVLGDEGPGRLAFPIRLGSMSRPGHAPG